MNTAIQRKRRRTAAEIEELLSRYRQTPLSQAEFVKAEGVGMSTLYKYRKRASKLRAPAPAGFIEVEPAPTQLTAGGSNFYKILCGAGFTLEVPGGFCRREVSELLELVLTAGAR